MKSLLICTGLLVAAAALGAQQPAASPAETTTGSIGGKAITISYA